MQKRSWLFLSGIVLVVIWVSTPLFAEDKIQAFVSPNGRVVFTNLVDNAPAPVSPVLPVSTDLVASEMPAGTAQPDAPNSGGVREPSQYWLTKFGLFELLFEFPPV